MNMCNVAHETVAMPGQVRSDYDMEAEFNDAIPMNEKIGAVWKAQLL